MDVVAVARRERIGERLNHHFGDVLSWIEVVSGLVLAGLVIAGVLPAWTVVIVLLVAVRPFWRLMVRSYGPPGQAGRSCCFAWEERSVYPAPQYSSCLDATARLHVLAHMQQPYRSVQRDSEVRGHSAFVELASRAAAAQ